jgi:hypothetical protein
MKRSLVSLALFACVGMASAQMNQTNQCPPTATNCTGSNQNSGDVSTTNNNGNTHSTSSMLGNSSASNASGNNINPNFDNRAQTTQNATNTTTGMIQGGNNSASTGPSSAIGNSSSNDNRSSVGNTSSNSGGNVTGGNTMNGGANTATTGNNTNNLGSSSGGNILGGASATNGPNTNTNQGGNTTSTNANLAAGGAGGAGGNATGGAGGTANSASGVAGSGNSANQNTAAQGQGQGQSSSNRTSSNSNQNASTRSGSDNAISVDASDRSSNSYTDNSKVIFIPPVVPPTPPSTLSNGQIIKETTACGPLQRVVKTPVIGKDLGWIWNSNVEQGFTYDLEPVVDGNGVPITYGRFELPDGTGYRLIGNQAIIFAAVVGTASSKNIAIGGGGSNGNWGQGGGGNSGAIQQLITNIQLKVCDVGTFLYPRPPVVKILEIEVPRKKNNE